MSPNNTKHVLLSEQVSIIENMPATDASANKPQQQQQQYAKVQHFNAGSVLADVGAALCCGAAVSPLVAIVDKTIIARSKGLVPSIASGLASGVKTMVTNPADFFLRTYRLPVATVMMVYAGTYIAGNLAQSHCESRKKDVKMTKFALSSVANVATTNLKDTILLRSMSAASVATTVKSGAVGATTAIPAGPKPVPLKSKGLMVLRDSMTIGAGFSLPPFLASFLTTRFGVDSKQAMDFSMFFCPVTAQLFNAHFHLVALRWQENPTLSIRQCLREVQPMFWGTVAARMLRIVPAYGFGGMINIRVRDSLQKKADPTLNNNDNNISVPVIVSAAALSEAVTAPVVVLPTSTR